MENNIKERKLSISPDTLRKLRKYVALELDVENIVGAGLVTVFAPVAVKFVPAGQKIAKDTRLGLYDKVAGAIANDDNYMKGHEEELLSDNTKKGIENMMNEYIDKKAKKELNNGSHTK